MQHEATRLFIATYELYKRGPVRNDCTALDLKVCLSDYHCKDWRVFIKHRD